MVSGPYLVIVALTWNCILGMEGRANLTLEKCLFSCTWEILVKSGGQRYVTSTTTFWFGTVSASRKHA